MENRQGSAKPAERIRQTRYRAAVRIYKRWGPAPEIADDSDPARFGRRLETQKAALLRQHPWLRTVRAAAFLGFLGLIVLAFLLAGRGFAAILIWIGGLVFYVVALIALCCYFVYVRHSQ